MTATGHCFRRSLRTWRGSGKHAYEPVSATGQCFDVTRFFRRVPQDVAQSLDGAIQARVKVNECVRGPEPLAKFLARNHVTGTFQQKGQDAKWLVLDPQADAALADFARA